MGGKGAEGEVKPGEGGGEEGRIGGEWNISWYYLLHLYKPVP